MINCPHCNKSIDTDYLARRLAALGGSVTSSAKTEASRQNGKKGGRPKKTESIKEETYSSRESRKAAVDKGFEEKRQRRLK